MIEQHTDLVMAALGNRGPTPRWYGPPLEDGVHLRWAFRAARGFPSQGFAVSRRAHRPGTLLDLPAASLGVSPIRLPELARRVVVRVAAPPSVPTRRRPGMVEAQFQGVPLASTPVEVGRGRRAPAALTLEADAIDAVRVTAGLTVTAVRYVPVSQDAERGWQQLTRLCLPLTSPTYPCHPGPPNPAADWQTAADRIPPAVRPTYLGTAPGGSGDARWTLLYTAMASLFGPPIPAALALAAARPADPAAAIAPADMMLLASVDPYVARILGLAWVDPMAVAGQRYDYRVVGTWDKSQLKAPEVSVDFEADAPGDVLPHTFVRDAVIARTARRGTVTSVSGAPWNDTRHGLDLGSVGAAELPVQTPYLRLQLPEPVGELQLYLQVSSGEPVVATSTAPAVTTRWSSADGHFLIVAVAAQNASDRIADVVVRPAADRGPLRMAVCKVGLLPAWSPPMNEPLAWICYGVTANAPAGLPAPAGLRAVAVPAPTRELDDGSLASGPRAGLAWTIPLAESALLPREPIRYTLERQSLGNGTAPGAVNGATWQRVLAPSPAGVPTDVPVTASPPDGEAGHLYLDDPAVALAQLQADRFYAYRVAGIDLFGRLGEASAAFVCDLADDDGPPPPIDVEAKYLDPADPLLTDDERSWVATDPPRSGVKVKWRWSAERHRQAPDLREFRIYLHPGRLNALVGTVTAVAPNADGTFTVTTDRALPESAVDAFIGETLASGNVNFTVLHNTAGANVMVTVRPPAAPPPALPAIGPFTLSIRGPSPLSGTVVAATPHLDGTVTLVTDRTTSLAADALAGKRLAQDGRTFAIVQSTSGRALRLTVRGAGLPPRVPRTGGFAVLDSVVTGGRPALRPVLEAPGNPLHVDYRSAENWQSRLAVEPAGASETYEVVVPWSLVFEAGAGAVYASVAVSAADDKDYVADSARWNDTPLGGRRGNEGLLSAPVVVQRTRRLPPPRPMAPDVGTGLASPADYHGNSTILVRWTAVPGMRVQVHRAMEAAIVVADRAARATRSTARAEYPWLSDEDFAALVAAIPDYAALSDERLRALASLPGNEDAFGLLTSPALSGEAYTATLNGRATSRHYFAITLVDAAGNRSRLGLPSRPVRAPRTMSPPAPAFSRVLAGDRQITLTWSISRDADVVEYRVYRADTEAAAHQLETMMLVHSQSLAADPTTRQPEAAYVDAPLPGLRTFWYRLVAVAENGPLSAPSALARGRAIDEALPQPPAPVPSWVESPPGAWRAHVTWSSAHETILQQRAAGEGTWQSLTAWRASGDHTIVDDAAERSRTYQYRVWARTVTGAIAIGAPVSLPGTE